MMEAGTASRGQKNLWGMVERFIGLIVMTVSQVYTYDETDQITGFKYVQFIVPQITNK